MSGKTFESAVKELEKTITELENGEVDLDNAIEKYTEAMKLIEFCENKIDNANKTINKIIEENGSVKDFEITN